MDERQSLETLRREEKTAARALAQLSEKEQTTTERKVSRTEELATLTEKRQEVCILFRYSMIKLITYLANSWKARLQTLKGN